MIPNICCYLLTMPVVLCIFLILIINHRKLSNFSTCGDLYIKYPRLFTTKILAVQFLYIKNIFLVMFNATGKYGALTIDRASCTKVKYIH